MHFRILGPVTAADDNGPITLKGPRVRALLAYLLLHANTAISTSVLIDELWGDDPPTSGPAAVQNLVARLRRSLGARLVTQGSAYVVNVQPGELDLLAFHELVKAADRQPNAAERADLLSQALGLWTGEALTSVGDAAFAAREAARLQSERIAATADRIDAELELGRHNELVAELSALAAQHPLDERFCGQLMLALYRSGRQTAALDVYREMRALLANELGLEPSRALRELERGVLQQDSTVDAPRRHRSAPVSVPDPVRRPGGRRVAVLGTAAVAIAAVGVLSALALSRDDSPAEVAAATSLPTTSAAAPDTATRPAPRTDAEPAAGAAKTTAAKLVKVEGKPASVNRKPAPVPATRFTTATTAREAAPRPAIASTTAPSARPRTAPPKAAPPKQTTRAGTTTRPTTPTATTPTPVDREPTSAPVLADSFDGPPAESSWHVYSTGMGPTVTQTDGHMEAFIPGSSIPWGDYQQIGATFETRCRFTGDFDARIAYELLEWPARASVNVTLAAFMKDRSEYPQIFRISQQNGDEAYHSFVRPKEAHASTADRTGRLRLARRNDVLTTYYWRDSRWVALGSSTARGIAAINVAAITTAGVYSRENVRVSFDNFAVFAAEANCP